MAITQKTHLRSPIRHMVRQIAAVSNPQMGYKSVAEVDSEIGSLLLQGYRLISTHFLGAQKDTTNNLEFFGLMYIFQMEPSELELLKKESLGKQAE